MPLLRVSASDSGTAANWTQSAIRSRRKKITCLTLHHVKNQQGPRVWTRVIRAVGILGVPSRLASVCTCVWDVCLPWSRSHRVHCSFCSHPPTPHARVLDSTVLRTERGKGPGTSVPVVRGPFPWHLGLLALLAPLEPL